jgi:hypothetical protein
MANEEITREQLHAALADGDYTVVTKGENVLGYVDESPDVDLSSYICEVCERPFTEHDPEQARRGVGRLAHFPDEPSWEGLRCPAENAPES